MVLTHIMLCYISQHHFSSGQIFKFLEVIFYYHNKGMSCNKLDYRQLNVSVAKLVRNKRS